MLVSESLDKNKHSSEAIRQFPKEAGFETGDWEREWASYLGRGPTPAEMEDNVFIKRGEKTEKSVKWGAGLSPLGFDVNLDSWEIMEK